MFDEKKLINEVTSSRTPVSLAELLRIFRVPGTQRREFRRILKNLEDRGAIQKVRGKHYTAPTGKTNLVIGRLEVTSKGFGFVRPDWGKLVGAPPFEGDLFIPERRLGSALDGDLVRAEFLGEEEQGANGRIDSVIEHAHTRIVGQFRQVNKRIAEVLPRNKRISRRVEVPLPNKKLGVKDYDWVEVEVTNFPDAPANLSGEVRARLGDDETRGIDVLLVLRDLGIIEEFPKSVEDQVKDMHFDWEEDLKRRTDFRGIKTLTIDPATAKDFDDGLSIEKLPRGAGWRLYVHIADVAHFVKIGTALDTEALDRATSVYPVDRVVPMLPQKLSNYLCSLVPHEDRLTMTAVMEISKSGKINKKEFHNSVIHSDARLTYEQAQAVYDEVPGAADNFPELVETLIELRDVSRVLRDARFKRGALDLDIPEVKIVFDESGASSDIKFYERFESHKVVEECMLIANEAVAQYLTEKEAPLLYRIHEQADQERLEKVVPILAAFGIKLNHTDGEITPKDLQAALEQAQKLPAGHVLRRIVLRALKRAEYDPDNTGHFGLASDCYCHFTSPIRRYPDVIVHRQLKSLLYGEPLVYKPENNELEDLGEHTSQRERRAQEAEWESTEIKAMEFMGQFLGDEFEAFIISVHQFGMFVELVEHPVEGFIRVAQMRGDFYRLDDLGIMLKGQRTGRVYRIGDKIKVRLEKVNPMAREMDLTLIESEEGESRSPRRKEPKQKPFYKEIRPGRRGRKKR
jgi:ribonuclease R